MLILPLMLLAGGALVGSLRPVLAAAGDRATKLEAPALPHAAIPASHTPRWERAGSEGVEPASPTGERTSTSVK
jgi:hypothetical protein